MVTKTSYLFTLIYCSLVNWTFEIWSLKASDNINRDKIKWWYLLLEHSGPPLMRSKLSRVISPKLRLLK
jgi:hypothetical protein